MLTAPINTINLLILTYFKNIINKSKKTNIKAVRELFKNKTLIKENADTKYKKKLLFFFAKIKLINDKNEKIIPCVK